MQTASQPISAPIPVMSTELLRRLPWAVVGSVIAAGAVSAAVVLVAGRSDWWPGFIAATAVAVIGAIISITLLSRVAGKTVDHTVTMTMAAAAVRMGVSLIGLLVTVKGLKTPPEPTGFMICGYYAATLLVESTLLARATRGPAVKTGERNG